VSIREFDDGLARCAWLNNDPLYIDYHDTEWGQPISGDDAMFERLSLEGFQAGLSWLTILKRREDFRSAFNGFRISDVARFDQADVERLLQDDRIIRHRGKIEATIHNAKVANELKGGIEAFVHSFTPAADRRGLTQSPESLELSQALRKIGFKFVGPTTMHALMQAIGMVNDHDDRCFRKN
jgi:DNA-3-methyladenine glycosylase I